MKKYFKILLNVIIINLLFINSINSKTLPPGTGGAADVPANVLILLDVSGSMGWDIQEGLNYGNDVQAVAPITNSGSVLTYTRNTLRQTDQAGNAQENIHPNRRELTHNRNNFGLGDNRKKVVYYDNQIFTYDNRRDRLYRYEYANNNIQLVEFMNNQNFSQMFLSGDNLILMSQNGGSYRVKDLTALNVNATQCNMARNSTLDRIQRLNSNAQNPTFTFNVDASGNLIAFGQERNNPVRLYKFASAGTCFNDEPNETFERNNNNNFNQPSSIVGHPTNENIFFVTDAGRHNLQRITVANTAITINETVGSFGGINANYNPTNKNNIRFNQPVHIAIESSTSTIYVADQRNRAVQSFDFDLDFQNVTGFRSTMSRLEGARRAIRSVVTDSSLIASVNFGYGIWSDYNVWWSQWGRFCRFGHCSMPRTTAMIRHGLDWLGQYWWIREVLLHSDIFGLGPDRFPGFENWDNGRMEGIPCSPLGCIEVLADRNGAALTNARIGDAQPMYGTNANFFATLAEDYFNHPTLSPIDPNSDCQDNYIIVVGDGDFTSGVNLGLNRIATLANRQNSPVQTIPIAYGPGITANGLAQFDRLAERGGTGNAVIAESPAQLRARLADIIRNIQADKLAFTAPAITSKVGEGGFLYQAQFQYRQNKEWIGSLSATAITDEGTLAQDFSWEAARNLPLPNSRNIWTVIPGVDYMGNWNNFTEDNSILINEQFRSLGNEVGDYHNDTPTSAANVGTARCSNSGDSIASIQNGNTDDIRGLISFIRGEDYFDYDSDCLLNEPRLDDNGLRGYLGDIYHSELVVVGPPNANTNFIQKNEEAYFRSVNNYQAFKDANKNRTKTIYVGSNNGILHAFNAETGQELWGFVPPLLIGKLPLVVNPGLNNRNPQGDRGGSSAIYAVDGSPVVHDMYMTHPVFGGVNWYTIMMVPFGRGGAGYSVLDVTNPIAPVHLYSIYNDSVNNEVLRMNHLGVINRFDYVDETYSWLDLDEVNTVRDNYQADNNVNSTCNDTLTTSCYRGRNFNLPVSGLTRDDITIFLDRRITTAYQVSQNGGNTLISFNAPQTYNGDTSGQSQNPSNLNLSIEISPDAVARLSTNLPARYNYTKLGETWSSPRIFRMPVSSNRDIYAAVMGAGYGASSKTVGSGVFVINMSDILSEPGQIERKIDIPDVGNFNGDIINSVVATPVVITADQTTGVNYKGALVYVNDLEGKITKINLTDMTESNTGERIELYDSTEIFRSISNATNGRYMFHSMDTAIGTTSKNLWLYAGTGDYERVTTRNSNVDNLLIGFRDKNFPYYKNVNDVVSAQMLTACQDTSNDSTGVNCPLDSDDRVLIPGGNAEGVTVRDWGWYIKLENSSKVVAEPTVTRGVAYFPIYEPTSSQNQCEAGSAYVCAVDDECGTNFSGRLGTNTGANRTKQCFYVGTGVLSKLVVFGNKLFANIAGASTQEKTDLVQLEGIQEDVEALRSSWREGNF